MTRRVEACMIGSECECPEALIRQVESYLCVRAWIVLFVACSATPSEVAVFVK